MFPRLPTYCFTEEEEEEEEEEKGGALCLMTEGQEREGQPAFLEQCTPKPGNSHCLNKPFLSQQTLGLLGNLNKYHS